MRAELATLAPGRARLGAIELHLREQLAGVLKTAPERLDLQKPMGTMGVDSLLALEFVRRLSRSMGIKVPATVVFNYPTIRKLAVLLESRMGFSDTDNGTSPVTPPVSQTQHRRIHAPRDLQTSSSSSSESLPVATIVAGNGNGVDTNELDMSELDAIRALTGRKR